MSDRADHLRARSEQERVAGHHVEAAWLRFYARAPHDLSPAHYDFARAMFYAGVGTMFSSVKSLAQSPDLTKQDLDYLHEVDLELAEHEEITLLEGMAAGRA